MKQPEITVTVATMELTLRDWFAGQALQGLAPKYIAEKHEGYDAGYFTREAYEVADAMLATRRGN